MVQELQVRRAAVRRRERLLGAARELFACHGFHATGMTQISERSGVAIGQIYRDFANKEAIIAAVVEAGIGNLFAQISSLEQGTINDEAEARKRVSSLLLRVISDDGRQPVLEFFAEASRNPEIANYLHVIDERARKALILAFSAASPAHVGDAHLEDVADLLLACLSGVAARTIANPAVHIDQLIAAMSRIIVHELYST